MADFFDRLLARHAPGGGGAARVRPRLPGPFERVQGAQTVEDDVPVAPPPPSLAVPSQAAPPPERAPREQRTGQRPAPRPVERLTPPAQAPSPAPQSPPAPHPPGPRPAAPPPAVHVHHHTRPAGNAPARPASPPPRPGPAAAPALAPALVPAVQPLPAALDRAAAARAAAPSPSAQRRGRPPAEPSVEVRIGRLEVTAAAPARPAGREAAPARRTPALSLDDFLARGGQGRTR